MPLPWQQHACMAGGACSPPHLAGSCGLHTHADGIAVAAATVRLRAACVRGAHAAAVLCRIRSRQPRPAHERAAAVGAHPLERGGEFFGRRARPLGRSASGEGGQLGFGAMRYEQAGRRRSKQGAVDGPQRLQAAHKGRAGGVGWRRRGAAVPHADASKDALHMHAWTCAPN